MINHHRKPYPSRSTPTVFVLWGDAFEEATATVMVAELRDAAFRVKIVGLNGQAATGVHGTTLYTDMPLGQALKFASTIACIVVPCSLARLQRIANDPRLITLFEQAAQNGATFVLNHTLKCENLGRKILQQADAHVELCPASRDLVTYAQQLATVLPNPLSKLRASAKGGSKRGLHSLNVP